MQGRLLPKYKNNYQAHPVGYWQNEFFIAKKLGLDLIEFILDFDGVKKNPLMNMIGLEEIKNVTKNSGVDLNTVCADYFMVAPLHSVSADVIEESKQILNILIRNCSSLGISDIVIPCIDNSSLSRKSSINSFIQNIKPGLELAEKLNINLALESDLQPIQLKKLLKSVGSTRLTINYDTGNSSAMGFNPIEEFKMYGYNITDIHIKDRILKGESVLLGEGNTNFKTIFQCINDINYSGPLIMEAYRNDDGLQIFKKQLKWFKEQMNKSLSIC